MFHLELDRTGSEYLWCNPGMLERTPHLQALPRKLKANPVAGLLGPRKVGKTTLAGQGAASWRSTIHRFDLEDELSRQSAA